MRNMQFHVGAHYVCVGRNFTTLKKTYRALCILYDAADSQNNQQLASQCGISNNDDLLNSSTKAGNLRRGVFWLEVKYIVLSIHHLAASSRGLHFFESHSPMESPFNSDLTP